MRLRIHIDRPAPRKLQPVVDALAKGEVIIHPTDTGYAFGCALSSSKGASKLKRLKDIDERSRKPLAMMVNDISDFGKYGILDNRGYRLVRRILPGPYTIILRASAEVGRTVKNRDHEIGLRMPQCELSRVLVEMLGEPLLVGSVTAADVEPELEDAEVLEQRHRGDVAAVIDSGPLWPDPSTVLRIGREEIEVLREGQGPIPD